MFQLKLLSAEELIQQRKRTDKSLPHGCSSKFLSSDDSWLVQKQISKHIEEQYDCLKEQRVAKFNDLCLGEWKPDLGKVLLSKEKGKLVINMGKSSTEGKFLEPEEALFLMEAGFLEITCAGVPLSIQEAYSSFLKDKMTINKYNVYSYLTRIGYIVVRHQGKLNISAYEKKIKIDQYAVKTKRNRKNENNSKAKASGDTKKPGEQEVIIIDDNKIQQSEIKEVEVECLSDDSDIIIENVTSDVPFKITDVITIDDEPIELKKRQSPKESLPKTDNNRTKVTRTSSNKTYSPSTSKKHHQHRTVVFPDFFRKRFLTLQRPPSHLLPVNVKPQKAEYKLDYKLILNATKVISVNREYRDQHSQDYNYRGNCSPNRAYRGNFSNGHNYRGNFTRGKTHRGFFPQAYNCPSNFAQRHSERFSQNQRFNPENVRQDHLRTFSNRDPRNFPRSHRGSLQQSHPGYFPQGQSRNSYRQSCDDRNDAFNCVNISRKRQGKGLCQQGMEDTIAAESHRDFLQKQNERSSTKRGRSSQDWETNVERSITAIRTPGSNCPLEDSNYYYLEGCPAELKHNANFDDLNREVANIFNQNSAKRDIINRTGAFTNKIPHYMNKGGHNTLYPSSCPKLKVKVKNWTEFKVALESRSATTGDVLWEGKIKPLIGKKEVLTTAKLQTRIQLTKTLHLSKTAFDMTDTTGSNLEIDFDIYAPGAVYRKTCPSLPNIRLIITSFDAEVPSLSELGKHWHSMNDEVPIVLAVVADGDVSFFAFHDIEIPFLVPFER